MHLSWIAVALIYTLPVLVAILGGVFTYAAGLDAADGFRHVVASGMTVLYTAFLLVTVGIVAWGCYEIAHNPTPLDGAASAIGLTLVTGLFVAGGFGVYSSWSIVSSGGRGLITFMGWVLAFAATAFVFANTPPVAPNVILELLFVQ